jgi:glutathione synthase/RimK-type ligase-like ATP-grasp enzyme
MGIESAWGPSLSAGPIEAISIHDDSHASQLELISGGPLRVGAVWHRRPKEPEPPKGVLDSDRPFVSNEWLLFQRNVLALAEELTGTLWVNSPRAAVGAENKLLQLRAARCVGLRVPETLLSNDARAVRAFIARQGRVVHKTFTPHMWRNAETGQCYTVNATLLDSTSSFDDASISVCPGIFQTYVDKVCDLRVTIIGDRMFAVRLRSIQGTAFVDWRSYTYHPEMAVDVYELPERCRDQLRALMSRLGLVFGCVDLVVDGEGDIHFLEVNQGGQYLFAEERVESLPLLQAMCALLAEGRVDYSLAPSREVSMRGFLSSAYCDEWRRRQADSRKVENWLCSGE